MTKEQSKQLIDLADYLDRREAKIFVLRRRVKQKIRTPLSEYGLDNLARAEINRGRVSFKTHRIQIEGSYPDLIWNFTEPQRRLYYKKLIDLEVELNKEYETLLLECRKLIGHHQ